MHNFSPTKITRYILIKLQKQKKTFQRFFPRDYISYYSIYCIVLTYFKKVTKIQNTICTKMYEFTQKKNEAEHIGWVEVKSSKLTTTNALA